LTNFPHDLSKAKDAKVWGTSLLAKKEEHNQGKNWEEGGKKDGGRGRPVETPGCPASRIRTEDILELAQRHWGNLHKHSERKKKKEGRGREVKR